MTEQPKTEQIQAKHTFSHEEIAGIAVKMAGVAQEYDDTENEFASLKADYSAKLKKIDLERDTLVQRIRDGFEMRPATAYVRFDHPEKGRKTYYREYEPALVGEDSESWNGVIREEAMSGPDFQRELPISEDQLATAAGVNSEIDQLAEQAQNQPSEHHAEIGDSAKEFEQTKDVLTTAAQPIGTSLEQKLTEAAAGKSLSLVEVDFAEGYAPEHYILKFSKKAKMQGWPEACIQLIRQVCEATADHDTSVEAGVRVQQVLRAHSVPVPPKNAVRVANIQDLPPLKMQINSVSLDSQERFMTEFQRAANEAQWSEPAQETVGNLMREETTVAGMHQFIKPYLAK